MSYHSNTIKSQSFYFMKKVKQTFFVKLTNRGNLLFPMQYTYVKSYLNYML
jgi:hypothetical protein